MKIETGLLFSVWSVKLGGRVSRYFVENAELAEDNARLASADGTVYRVLSYPILDAAVPDKVYSTWQSGKKLPPTK